MSLDRFSSCSKRAILAAVSAARETGVPRVQPGHLLLALAGVDGAARDILRGAGLDADGIRRSLGRGPVPPASGPAGAPPLEGNEEATLERDLVSRGVPRPTAREVVARLQLERAGYLEPDRATLEVLGRAALESGRGEVGTARLLAVLLASASPTVAEPLAEEGIDPQELLRAIGDPPPADADS